MRLAINLSSQLTRCEVRVKLDDLPGEDKEILWSYFTLNWTNISRCSTSLIRLSLSKPDVSTLELVYLSLTSVLNQQLSLTKKSLVLFCSSAILVLDFLLIFTHIESYKTLVWRHQLKCLSENVWSTLSLDVPNFKLHVFALSELQYNWKEWQTNFLSWVRSDGLHPPSKDNKPLYPPFSILIVNISTHSRRLKTTGRSVKLLTSSLEVPQKGVSDLLVSLKVTRRTKNFVSTHT